MTGGLNMEEVGYSTNAGRYDIGPYSKIGTWPLTDGAIFYSPCYATGPLSENVPGSLQCFMTVDLTDPKTPKRLAKVYAYDLETSPAPAATHPVWTGKAILNLKSPCDAFVLDPKNPSPSCWDPGWNTHTHYSQMKVIHGRKILAVNQERKRTGGVSNQANFHGVAFYDVTDPTRIAFLSRWEAPAHYDATKNQYVYAGGTHHFNWGDGPYLFIGTEYEGYQGKILVILDVRDPKHPTEASHWALPGQSEAEYPNADWVQQSSFGGDVKCVYDASGHCAKLTKHVGMHYASVYGDRAYLSYHQAGLVILDVGNPQHPRFISRVDYLTPEFAATSPDAAQCGVDDHGTQIACGNTHAAKRIPYRPDLLMVSDEWFSCPYGHVRIFDISDERKPEILSHFLTPDNTQCNGRSPVNPTKFPARGPSSHLGNAWDPNLYFMAWYGMGVRAIDITNPYKPTEVGYFEYDINDDVSKDFPELVSARLAGSDTYDVIFGPENLLYVTDGSSGMRVVKCSLGACHRPPLDGSPDQFHRHPWWWSEFNHRWWQHRR